MNDQASEPRHSPMLDGATFQARLDAVAERLAQHAAGPTPGGLTDPDPDTPEERWQAGQVWAHLAEFVPYWHEQASSVVAAYAGEPVPFGRVKTDAARKAAIEVGRNAPIAEHMAALDAALQDLRRYLVGLTSAEWNAVGLHQTRGEMDIEAIVERFIVAHLEEHAEQLDRLRGDSSA